MGYGSSWKGKGYCRWDMSDNPKECRSVYDHLLRIGKRGKGFLIKEGQTFYKVSVPSDNSVFTVGFDRKRNLKFVSRE
ncbi:MAG: hypothetical protein LKJ88_04240 [Bacilli bacterium]|jgi:hypothetical protein|nr:hypothetical protein [Bacilli bacterium]